jgi:hypothetical protein
MGGGGGGMLIWRRLAVKPAFCGFKVEIFAVMANFALTLTI